MNRVEFMGQLERLLWDIPESDRLDAIAYYNDYFDEAGAENEAQVIRELGSPGKVAAIIKADLNASGNEQAEYTEHGYSDGRNEENPYAPSRRETGYQDHNKKRKIPLVLLIVLLVFDSRSRRRIAGRTGWTHRRFVWDSGCGYRVWHCISGCGHCVSCVWHIPGGV